MYHFYSTKIKIHFQDLSKQNCIQIPFNESEIDHLKDLSHRSNRGIIYHLKGTFSVSNFFIFACKNDVGPHFKGSFSVEEILDGNVCGNKKNRKIKILNIRNITINTDDVDQNDDILNNTIYQTNNIVQQDNSTHDDDNHHNSTLDDDNDPTNFQDGIPLWKYPFGDVNFWFKTAILAIAIILILIIGIIAYCLKRLI